MAKLKKEKTTMIKGYFNMIGQPNREVVQYLTDQQIEQGIKNLQILEEERQNALDEMLKKYNMKAKGEIEKDKL